DGLVAKPMGTELCADPQRAVARLRAHARQPCRETAVVLPPGLGHAFDSRLRFRPLDAPGLEFADEFLARVLAANQQRERALRGGQLGATTPPPLRDALSGGARSGGAFTRTAISPALVRARHAQALASLASFASLTPLPALAATLSAPVADSAAAARTAWGISRARSSASILFATSGFSLRYRRAFSLPWPMRSSPQLYQAPAFSTSFASTPISISSPSRLMPSP